MTKDLGLININDYIEKGYIKVSSNELIPGTDFDDSCFPENKWRIIENNYRYKDPEAHYWNICSYDILKYNESTNEYEPYIDFGRNYHTLGYDLLVYVVQKGEEFILTSSNYMYLTIINLTRKEIKSYFYGIEFKNNDGKIIKEGFCPVKIIFDQISDTENKLIVNGCFWAWPYENLTIENVDLNDLSCYNFNNENIKREYEEIEEDDEDDEEED